MTLAPLSGSFRPGGPTTPRPVTGSGSGSPEPYHLQFLTAEERSTAVLMGYFQDARLELEDFIRETGDLSVSDATYYRQLLDETNRIASTLNEQGAKWTSSTIDEAYSAGWRQNSSIVVPQKALEALSRDTLSLISQTTDGIRQTVRQSIAQGILQGLPADQVRARILASGLSNIPHWPSAEYRAGVIARTETMRAYNAGHLSAMEENGARFAEWIASPDEAVCSICGPRDGVIFRLDAGMDLDDPYPAALALPKLPAHPRCRCTTRPVYRDPDGKVIGTPNAQDPKLPKDAMGGKDKPLVPPAAGDFLASLKSLDKLDDAARAYWRNVDIDGIRVEIPPSATLAAALREAGQPVTGRVRTGYEILSADLTKARFAALMDARYGVKLVGNDLDVFLASAGQKRQWLEALESYRTKLGLAWDADDVFRTFSVESNLGMHPNGKGPTPAYYRAVEQKIALATPSAKILLGKKEGYGAYDGHDGLGSLFQHELAHALERKLLTTSALKEQWEQIHVSTKAGLSPAMLDDQLEKARKEIRDSNEIVKRLQAQIDEIEATGGSDSMVPFYRQTIETHQKVADAYTRQVAALRELRDAAGTDVFPSDYASTNAHEDFAETTWFYLNEPARLRELSPKRYAFMARIIGIER